MISRRPSTARQGIAQRCPERGIGSDGDYGCDADNPATLAHLEIGRVEPDVGPFPGKSAVQELANAFIDVLAELRHRAFRDALQTYRLHQLVYAAGRGAADPGLLDHRDKRLLRGLARLKTAGEVAALPQLRHLQVQRAQTGIESAFPIPIAPDRPLIGPHDQL